MRCKIVISLEIVNHTAGVHELIQAHLENTRLRRSFAELNSKTAVERRKGRTVNIGQI